MRAASGLAARAPDVLEEEALFPADLTDPQPARTVLLSVPTGHHVEDLLRGPFLRSLLAPSACSAIGRGSSMSGGGDGRSPRSRRRAAGYRCLAPPGSALRRR